MYTDIPYLYKGASNSKNEKSMDGKSSLSQRKQKNAIEIGNFVSGIDYAILDDFVRVLKKINIYIWCSKAQINDIMTYFINKGCNFEIIVWGKTNPPPLCKNTYLSDLEYCLFFREKGVKIYGDYSTKSKFLITSLNVQDKEWYDHPTIKPLDFVKNHIINSTIEGEVVLDPFAGSGTTAVAAKELGRKYLTFELSEDFYNIAKDRLNGVSQFEKKEEEEGAMRLF